MSSEPWTSDVDRMLAHTLASNLLNQHLLHQAYARWHANAHGFRANKSAAAFGDYLVDQKYLTRWQCDRLQAGKYRGFFLDNYKVVEYLRKEGTDDKYLAIDMDRGERVVLAITSPSIAPFKNGRPGYRVTRSPAGRSDGSAAHSASTAEDLQTSIFVSDEPEPAARPVSTVPRPPVSPELAKIINPEPKPRRWRLMAASAAVLLVAASAAGYYFFGRNEAEIAAGSLVEAVRVGISAGQLESAVKKYEPEAGRAGVNIMHRGTGLVRYSLDNGECLVAEFNKLSDPTLGVTPADRVSDFAFLNFSDLDSEVSAELLPAIKLIHESRTSRPSSIIRATNELYHLGKDQAIDALREYYELAARDPVRGWRYDLQQYAPVVIARVLFVPPDGSTDLPTIRENPMRTQTTTLFASEIHYFPMLVEGDIPFAIVGEKLKFDMDNLMTAREFFRYCDRNTRMRREPLVPSRSPIEAAQNLLAKAGRTGTTDGWDRATTSMVQLQVISCLRDLGDPDLATLEHNLANHPGDANKADAIWNSVLAKYGQEKIVWDAKNGRFRRK